MLLFCREVSCLSLLNSTQPHNLESPKTFQGLGHNLTGRLSKMWFFLSVAFILGPIILNPEPQAQITLSSKS